jgi:hypothetical protein
MTQTYNYRKGLRMIVWVYFWGGGRTIVYLIDRDFESKKHRFSTNSYLEVLEAEINQVTPEISISLCGIIPLSIKPRKSYNSSRKGVLRHSISHPIRWI